MSSDDSSGSKIHESLTDSAFESSPKAGSSYVFVTSHAIATHLEGSL